ncbi:MAG: cardiolipin synthase [Phycisphaerales bacterium]|nr:cardiolipin synthase [Planctomycetota bacterium]MCH8508754.1 cardiolipin synthase [Phycisphaerales bacterium]
MPTWLVIIITATATLTITAITRLITAHEKKLNHRIETLYNVHQEQFLRSMGSLLQPSLIPDNRIDIYNNGHEIFPPMIEAIASAQRTITFETFIYWSGDIGRRFADALCERARSGVRVHVILDSYGAAKMDQQLLEDLGAAGAEVERYHPVRWYTLRKLNNRTHRKILVIDGHTGFTGGVGIADEWLGNARNTNEWRDCHFRIRGPAVAQLQRAFMDNWLKTHADVLHGEDYFPSLEPAGDTPAQVFMSSAAEGSESARLMFLLSIASAAQSIRIGTAYFVPDTLTIQTLIEARRRGASVRIITPGKLIDKQIVRHASRSRWGDLLDAGVEIHEYQPTMYHCKLMIIDDVWISVGSANFDNRSFRLNDEANLNAHDPELARRLAADFDADLSRSKSFTPEAWRKRPLTQRIREHAAGLLRAQL